MHQERLSLYTIDLKYIRTLAKADDNVLSISPQIGKQNRPFIGIIVICNYKQYCVPFCSPKEKHKSMKNDTDFSKIIDSNGKLIGTLNFNNMIPVRDDLTTPLSSKINAYDDPATRHYKTLLKNQLTFCQKNQDVIVKKANKLYKMITGHTAGYNLRRRCCDFEKLEEIMRDS